MNSKDTLEAYKAGNINIEQALKQLPNGVEEIACAAIDTDRLKRTGLPEMIYASGKTTEQVCEIVELMHRKGIDILATRVTEEMGEAVKKLIPNAKYNSTARTIAYKHNETELTKDYIAVVAAGTSDMPVVEEILETAHFLGNRTEAILDVGVAGIHRLFNKLDSIRAAKVIIVVAGMEGALASVVGGLVNKPVIGVPTSVGYGANLKGISALLSMLNSCASGVSVVNIDNGFGAACQASLINKL